MRRALPAEGREESLPYCVICHCRERIYPFRCGEAAPKGPLA